MRVRRGITLVIGLAAAMALLAGSVFVLGLDARTLSRELANHVSRQLGRPVTVAGAVGLEPGWTPTLELRDVEIGPPAGSDGPPTARLGLLKARLSLGEALRGRVLLHTLEVSNGTVYLHAADNTLIAGLGAPGPGAVTLEAVTLSQIHGRVQRAAGDLAFRIDSASIKPGAYLEGTIAGQVEGRDIAGRFSADPHEDDQLALEWVGNADGAALQARGIFAPGTPAPVVLEVRVDAPELRLKTEGQLSLESDTWHLRNANGTLRGIPFGAELALAPGPVPRISGALSIERLEVDTPGAMPASPGTVNLPPVELDVALRVGKVAYAPLPVSNLSGRLQWREGVFGLEDLQATAGGGRIGGHVRHAPDKTPRTMVDVTAQQLRISKTPFLAHLSGDLTGQIDARAAVVLEGRDLSTMRRTATGTVRVALDDARARARALETVVGGIHTLFDILVSGEAEWVELECAVAEYQLSGGVARSRLLILDSKHSQVVGSGTIGLDDGALDLQLVPRAKSVTLNLALPVTVTGTLDAPRFSPDPTGSTRRVAGLLAGALVFPPALIAAFADLGVADAGCLGASAEGSRAAAERAAAEASAALDEAGAALERSAEEAQKAVEDAATATTRALEDVSREAERAARELGRSLERLFGN